MKVGLVLVALSMVANAAPFTNGSFEIGPAAGTFTTLNNGSTSITGWTVAGSGVDYIGSYWTAQDGSRSLDLSALGAGSILQTFDTILNQVYLVNFWLAGNPAGAPPVKSLRVSAAGDQQDYTFNTTGKATNNMGWVQEQFIFTAASTSTTLSFLSLTSSSYGPALDNVSVTLDENVVPEPGTWMMLGGGLVLVGLRRKSLRKS
jgi:choice-of-anchor C domain-containing protein